MSPGVGDAYEGKAFWAGLEGVAAAKRHELAPGLVVEPCYGTIFAHPMLAVTPPEQPGAHHPAPWFACRGGHRNIEVRCQLYVAGDAPALYANRVASAWLAAASLRLLLCAPLRLALLSDTDFGSLRAIQAAQPTLISMEQEGAYTTPAVLEVDGYVHAWGSLLSAMTVAMQDERFRRAFSYMDGAWWVGSSAAFLVSIWTALEALLLEPRTVGIKKALAKRISELLVDSPPERARLYDRVTALYGARCDSAHEAIHPDLAPVHESAALAGAVFFAKAGAAIGERR